MKSKFCLLIAVECYGNQVLSHASEDMCVDDTTNTPSVLSNTSLRFVLPTAQSRKNNCSSCSQVNVTSELH